MHAYPESRVSAPQMSNVNFYVVVPGVFPSVFVGFKSWCTPKKVFRSPLSRLLSTCPKESTFAVCAVSGQFHKPMALQRIIF